MDMISAGGGQGGVIMKKEFFCWAAVSAAIMLVLPWLAVAFVKGDAEMAVCLLLFMVVDPMYSLIIGISAGRDMRHLWSLPVISALLYLCGAWIFFDMGETAFIQYAAVYLVLGIIIRKNVQEKVTDRYVCRSTRGGI